LSDLLSRGRKEEGSWFTVIGPQSTDMKQGTGSRVQGTGIK